MKKLSKTVCITLAAVLVLIIIVLTAINLFADLALKMGIESAASRALNVGVSVGDVELSILGGKVNIENLRINNPPGYQHDKLLELKRAGVKIEVSSLLGNVVNVKQINLDGVDITLEQRGISGNNLQDIISSLGTKEKKESSPGGKKLHIENLEISDITVKVKLLPVPGKTDTITLKLSPIRMTDLGSDNKLDTAKLSGKILLAIADGVAKQGAGKLPGELVDTMRLTLDKTIELSETASKEGKKIIEAGKEVIKDGKDMGQGVAEGLKGLLKSEETDK